MPFRELQIDNAQQSTKIDDVNNGSEMLLKILISICAIVFILVVPLLEISPSHVFNPAWPAHAKLHEVWQLSTNAGLSLLALWLAWSQRKDRLAALISFCVAGGFTFANVIKSAYGGSMAHPDGSELIVLGVNPAVGIVSLLTVGLILGLLFDSRRTN